MKAYVGYLGGAPLDYLIAQIEGVALTQATIKYQLETHGHMRLQHGGAYQPSLDWALAGPIIAREGIALREDPTTGIWYAMLSKDLGSGERAPWSEFTYAGGERFGPHSHQIRKRRQRFTGATAIEAALRCLVASKLGELVELPDEFMGEAIA